jgi:hypothetical protein
MSGQLGGGFRKLLPGIEKMTDAMQRDLAAADPKIYACANNLEMAREKTRQAALGIGGSAGWSLGDHFTNLAAVWVHMLNAVDKFGLLLPQGKRALDGFTHMYNVFSPFSGIDQSLRKREEQELPLPPIPKGGDRAHRPPPNLSA